MIDKTCEQRTADRTLPVVIKLILHEPKDQTSGGDEIQHRRVARAAETDLDFPTADSPKYEVSWCPPVVLYAIKLLPSRTSLN